jgi:hypothetical protein
MLHGTRVRAMPQFFPATILPAADGVGYTAKTEACTWASENVPILARLARSLRQA